MVGTMVDIIVKNIDEKMIDYMPRYIFGGLKPKKQNESFCFFINKKFV